jgi:ribosomal protein S27AE
MKGIFKVSGLSKPKSITCEPINNENTFRPVVNMDQSQFDALWDYKKNDWQDKMIAEIKYEGLRKDGTPIAAVLTKLYLATDNTIKYCPKCGSLDIMAVHDYWGTCEACGHEFV